MKVRYNGMTPPPNPQTTASTSTPATPKYGWQGAPVPPRRPDGIIATCFKGAVGVILAILVVTIGIPLAVIIIGLLAAASMP